MGSTEIGSMPRARKRSCAISMPYCEISVRTRPDAAPLEAARAVGVQHHRRGLTVLQARAEVLGDVEDDLVLLRDHGIACAGFVEGHFFDVDAARREVGQQVGRALGVRDGHGDVLFRLLLGVRDAELHQRRHQHRAEHRAEHQRRQQRAPVAQVLAEFLAEDGPDTAQVHLVASGLSSPMSATKASSRRSPPRARMSASVPAATTWPPAIITTSSQSCSTSCMTWLENSTQ